MSWASVAELPLVRCCVGEQLSVAEPQSCEASPSESLSGSSLRRYDMCGGGAEAEAEVMGNELATLDRRGSDRSATRKKQSGEPVPVQMWKGRAQSRCTGGVQ